MHKNSILRKITVEILTTLEWIIIAMPNSSFGTRLRLIYWKKKLGNSNVKFIGRNTVISISSGLDLGNAFVLGDFSELVINDSDPVYIGNDVAMARGTYLRSANHVIDDAGIPIHSQGHTSKKIEFNGKVYSIVIEDDVWVGANSIILTGAHIGSGSVISAGSVVSSEVPPFSIVVGNPARVVANRLKLAKLKAETGKNTNG